MKGRESKTGSIAFFLSFSIVFAESVLSSFRVQTRKVLLRLKVSWFFSTSPSQSQLTGQYWESEMTVSRVYMHIQKGIYHFKKAVNDETQLHNAMPPMPQAHSQCLQKVFFIQKTVILILEHSLQKVTVPHLLRMLALFYVYVFVYCLFRLVCCI